MTNTNFSRKSGGGEGGVGKGSRHRAGNDVDFNAQAVPNGDSGGSPHEMGGISVLHNVVAMIREKQQSFATSSSWEEKVTSCLLRNRYRNH